MSECISKYAEHDFSLSGVCVQCGQQDTEDWCPGCGQAADHSPEKCPAIPEEPDDD